MHVGREAFERIEEMKLSERQRLIMREAKAEGSISNAEVQEMAGVSDRTAPRDLNVLEEEGLLRHTDKTGGGTRYELA